MDDILRIKESQDINTNSMMHKDEMEIHNPIMKNMGGNKIDSQKKATQSDNTISIEELDVVPEDNCSISYYTSESSDSQEISFENFRERKEILADFDKKGTKKRVFGDSKLMSNIKASVKEVETIIDMSISLDEESLRSGLGELDRAYDKLLSYCYEYENKNGHKTEGKAGRRMNLVREIMQVTRRERDNIQAAAKYYKKKYPKVEKLSNWKEILLVARAHEEIKDIDYYGTKVRTEENAKQLDSFAALGRIAEYMGVSNVFMKNKYIIEDGDTVMCFEHKINGDRFTNANDFMKNCENEEFIYSGLALKKLQTIRNMEELLGIEFDMSDLHIRAKVNRGEESGRINYIMIEDIIVSPKHGTYMPKNMKRDDENPGVVMDRVFANNLVAMDEDIAGHLLSDVLGREEKKILKNNINKMRERLNEKDSRIMGEDEWLKSGDEVILTLRNEMVDKKSRSTKKYTFLSATERLLERSMHAADFKGITEEDIVVEGNDKSVVKKSDENAMEENAGVKYKKVELGIITAETMNKAYSNMWSGAKRDFNQVERYLQSEIEDLLKKEIRRRYMRKYEDASGKTRTHSYRSITIEGIKAILLDIKNWTYGKKDKGYRTLYQEVKNKFYMNAVKEFDEAQFMKLISTMAEKLESASDRENVSFEHDSFYMGEKYSARAQRVASFIKAAVAHGSLTANAKDFIENSGEKGVNAQSEVDGIVEGRTYIITEYHEKNNGQVTLTVKNSVESGVAEFVKYIDEDGNVKQVSGFLNPENEGTFEIDLNDFLRFFDKVFVAKNVMRKPEVRDNYRRI